MQLANQEMRRVLPGKDLQESGIKIFTALDPHIQRAAEESTLNTLSLWSRLSEVSASDRVTLDGDPTLVGGEMQFRGIMSSMPSVVGSL